MAVVVVVVGATRNVQARNPDIHALAGVEGWRRANGEAAICGGGNGVGGDQSCRGQAAVDRIPG